MKAKSSKSSKAKTASTSAQKVAAKKGTKPSAPKSAPAKPAARVTAVKPVAKAPVKSAAKPAPVAKVAAKSASKKPVPAKTAPRTFGKPGTRPAAAAKGKVPVKPAPRHIPKPASVATRRKEMAHFRELLLQKRQHLMRAYSISKGDSKSDLDNGTEDYVDYAVNSYAREFLLSLTEMDRKHLLLVEDALNRIDRGEYGRCQQCAEEINRKRLEVQPWARHCVRCQELEEQGLLPQYPLQAGDDADYTDEPEDAAPPDDDIEGETEAEEEVLDEEPLVVDGEDSEE